VDGSSGRDNGVGVYGNTNRPNGIGVYGYSEEYEGHGVRGYSGIGDGVVGYGRNGIRGYSYLTYPHERRHAGVRGEGLANQAKRVVLPDPESVALAQ
jgi:hypothetical protein